MMARWRYRTLSTIAAVVLVALLVPGALGEYEGPGQTGVVPIGDGGELLAVDPALGEGITHVALTGVPASVCRIDLEPTDDAPTSLLWAPGNDTAYVHAPLGARDSGFRVAAHWTWDVKNECTIEHDEQTTTYHDPRGRPYIDVSFGERRPYFELTSGTWERIAIPVTNDGTLNETVDLVLDLRRNDWRTANTTGTVGVEIGPEETYSFGFDLFVPLSEPERMSLVALRLEARESGITDRVTLAFDLKAGEQPPEPVAPPPPEPLPPWTPPVQESPLPLLLSFAALALLAALARRHRA